MEERMDSQKKYIFCNIGWMNKYQGLDSNDTIVNGGQFVDENLYGHEIFNFTKDLNGYYYGYVEPGRLKSKEAKNIAIERLKNTLNDYANGITVIWVARPPKSKGLYIVGWYENATIYKSEQFNKNTVRRYMNKSVGYYVKSKNVMLLKSSERTLNINEVAAGRVGRSNIWYAEKENKEFFKRISKYMSDKIIERSTDRSSGKKIVEEKAIDAVFGYYSALGYRVESVEHENKGWDLEAVNGKDKLLIEVKGLSADHGIIYFTGNEYSKMLQEKIMAISRIAIVTNIKKE